MKEKILQILEQNNISYALSGKNVGKNAIGIDCPFCVDDVGKHLGILPNKSGGYYYSCWRNKEHRGGIFFLFSKLLGISIDAVKELFDYTEPVTKILPEDKKIGGVDRLEFPPEFKEVKNEFPTEIFYNYLKRRGFDSGAIQRYRLMCALEGEWKNRIIIPVYINGQLVTWQGRTISDLTSLRYKSLSLEKSIRAIGYCLFNYDNLHGGKSLYITEGPFDAMKIDYYTRADATCLFTLNMSKKQEELLLTILPKYDRIFILLDNNAELASANLLCRLSYCKNIFVRYLPTRFKDAGEMNEKEIKDFIGRDNN